MIRSSAADPKLAAELIALNVEVMLAAATPAAKAAQSATTKIAIVMADPGDAVQLGFVRRLTGGRSRTRRSDNFFLRATNRPSR